MATAFKLVSLVLFFLLTKSVNAESIVFESGPTRVSLLELFTSEGCSSCPPAETALSKLVDDPRLWREFVPIAFHVDYWDRLGWKDPFASAEWTKRQHTYAAAWNTETVYTPEFVLNGREWRGATVPAAPPEAAGILKVALPNERSAIVTYDPAAGPARNFDVHIARLGFGLNMDVRAGENSGRKLRHDFVVLSLTDGKPGTEIHLPENQSNSEKVALAAWITKPNSTTPIQAVGGWLSSAKPGRRPEH